MTPEAKGRGILDTHIVLLPQLTDLDLLPQDPSFTEVTMAERSVGRLLQRSLQPESRTSDDH